jgi:hypothetical protein
MNPRLKDCCLRACKQELNAPESFPSLQDVIVLLIYPTDLRLYYITVFGAFKFVGGLLGRTK